MDLFSFCYEKMQVLIYLFPKTFKSIHLCLKHIIRLN
jgi:hypothetical protein